MPLVVPGVNFPVNKRSEWLDKLKGKRFIESEEAATDVNVSLPSPPLLAIGICMWSSAFKS